MTGAAGARRTYNPTAKLLHWTTAVLVALQLAIGWIMPDIHRGTRPVGLIAAHLTVGVLIVLVVAVRVAWRVLRPPTGSLAERAAESRVVAATHVLLYLLLVLVPLLGWANASSRDWTVALGPLVLPSLMSAGSPLGHQLGDIHGWLADALAGLLVLHAAAALLHHFVRKDDTLARML